MLGSKTTLIKILGILMLLGSGNLPGQITFEVATLPGNTPAEDTLFLVGNFNDWQPGDPRYMMIPGSERRITVDIPRDSFPISYKITRGTWPTVEGDEIGNAIPDRTVPKAPQTDTVIRLFISSWEDLPSGYTKGTVTIIVKEIPANTPPDAPIYVVGNFNSWHPGDPKYKMEKQKDGTYVISVPMVGDLLEYKFCRGNWETAEGRRNGRARYNREYAYDPTSNNIVYAEIETWEDISGNPINALTFIWLLAGVLGILLIVAINTLQNNNVSANRVLSILILLISVALIGRVAVYDRDIFQQTPKLLLVPDIILFLYAPVFVVYLHRLLFSQPLAWNSRIWLHFIPFVLHIIAWSPLLFMADHTFISLNTDLSLRKWFMVTGGISLAYNTVYWFVARRMIIKYRKTAENNYAYEENLVFLRAVMGVKAVCLLIWLASYAIGGTDILVDSDLQWLTERSQDLLFIVFSLTVFCLGYFAIREPEIFKMGPEIEEEPAAALPEETQEEAQEEEEREDMKHKLRELMETKRPYLNPKLTLATLSEMAGTNVHTLSKVINDGFGVNFNDFVNGYRVDEFKARVVEEEYKNHTLLSVALMAGFNSKTAFNRSFKKITQLTPREYLKQEGADS